MAWTLRPMLRPPAGLLPSRRQAEPALLRMLSRARRQQGALLLVRIAPGGEAAAAGHQRFLAELAAQLRIADLAWWEPGGVVLTLLEGTRQPEAVLARLQQQARRAGAAPGWRCAGFPEQGLTLEALEAELQEVPWTR